MFSAKEETIHQVFGEKRYNVPFYQRPYSWLVSNAEDLWDDLYTSWKEEGHEGSGYFLGSVVLVANHTKKREDIVDGQQRLLTLQLLLSAIARKIEERDTQRRLQRYVLSEEDEFAGTKQELVVEPGERYAQAFTDIINNRELDSNSTRSGKRFFENIKSFILKTEELSQEELIEFGKFIVQKAHLAVLRADSDVQALRIFSVLNDRGLDLHPVDILKARLIEKAQISAEKKKQYARRWEEYEEDFERSRFQDLMSHIRMIFVRGRSKKPLHDDILGLFKKSSDIELFLSKELPAFSSAFLEIDTSDSIPVKNLAEIGKRARFKDWEAPLIFILKNQDLLPNYETSVTRLSSIVAMMAITKMPDGQRAGRFGRIITELDQLIEKSKKIHELAHLSITKKEWISFRSALRGDAYSLRGLKAGMLWLDTISGDGERSVSTGEITVEHILPRAPGNENNWLSDFTPEKWKEYSNSIGNLVLMSGRSNRKIARRSFLEKKEYIKQKGGSPWVWTQDALNAVSWTEQAINSREERILSKAKSAFVFSSLD